MPLSQAIQPIATQFSKNSYIVIGYRLVSASWAFVNLLGPSDAYMLQSAWPSLVQIMACRLFGAKLLSEPMPDYCHLSPRQQISLKFEQNTAFFLFNKMHFKNFVCKMGVFLHRPQCVNVTDAGRICAQEQKVSCHFCVPISRHHVPADAYAPVPTVF